MSLPPLWSLSVTYPHHLPSTSVQSQHLFREHAAVYSTYKRLPQSVSLLYYVNLDYYCRVVMIGMVLEWDGLLINFFSWNPSKIILRFSVLFSLLYVNVHCVLVVHKNCVKIHSISIYTIYRWWLSRNNALGRVWFPCIMFFFYGASIRVFLALFRPQHAYI